MLGIDAVWVHPGHTPWDLRKVPTEATVNPLRGHESEWHERETSQASVRRKSQLCRRESVLALSKGGFQTRRHRIFHTARKVMSPMQASAAAP